VASADPDRSLVEQAQRELPYGTAAVGALAQRYSKVVFVRASRILGSEADAEEVVQEVFLRVFRSIERFRFERPFLNWLQTITLNTCSTILRTRRRERQRIEAWEREADAPEADGTSDALLRRRLDALLDELDPATRVALLLRFVDGCTFPEIAELLEMKESAVKMRVHRGSEKLRALWMERTREAGSGERSQWEEQK
jgi:RNA polymerase sigma-70 factor (ECF subfamily)